MGVMMTLVLQDKPICDKKHCECSPSLSKAEVSTCIAALCITASNQKQLSHYSRHLLLPMDLKGSMPYSN